MMNCCNTTDSVSYTLKSDQITHWMNSEWISKRPEADLRTVWSEAECTRADVLARLNPALVLTGNFQFIGATLVDCPVIQRLDDYDYDGNLYQLEGAFVYQFKQVETGEFTEVLVVHTHYADNSCYQLTVVAVADAFLPTWSAFTKECRRLAWSHEPDNEVYIIGGRTNSFVPTVDWEDVILPARLKTEIMEDVRSFFTKGVNVYRRLKLKPFRKLLLAGVPGTGKTMLCSALAKWALAEGYLVIYVSSAQKKQGDAYGSSFEKIQHALSVAANSRYPTLILLEELDAYLHEEEKALILNVLDGSESVIGDKGTLLISTTNYPEAIDERVLKRPGRLDRIFIIPETREKLDAEKMLRQYLGEYWQDVHQVLVNELVGYPGAFIREVAIYALTQMAYDDLNELSVDLLLQSFRNLKDQLEARDDFLKRRNGTPEASETETASANAHLN